jgi:tRNA pseudouridine38-40 synthase
MEETGDERTWKLVLAYDGTNFHGWQVQPDCATVQGELRAAIQRVTGEVVLPQGSGRTDAGVHAFAQVASFVLSAPIPEANFARALNRTLPAAIRVLQARIAPKGFHARHSARSKTYQYRIFRGEICPPWLARYVYGFKHPLDLEAMQQAAKQVLGDHDFTSFAATDPDLAQRADQLEVAADEPDDEPDSAADEPELEPRGNVRTIYDSEWTEPLRTSSDRAAAVNLGCEPSSWTGALGEDAFLIYRVRGSGFLHHMVRNLVGTFLEVGRGNLNPQRIPAILEARSRAHAGPTAPARGLFLAEVEYSENLP